MSPDLASTLPPLRPHPQASFKPHRAEWTMLQPRATSGKPGPRRHLSILRPPGCTRAALAAPTPSHHPFGPQPGVNSRTEKRPTPLPAPRWQAHVHVCPDPPHSHACAHVLTGPRPGPASRPSWGVTGQGLSLSRGWLSFPGGGAWARQGFAQDWLRAPWEGQREDAPGSPGGCGPFPTEAAALCRGGRALGSADRLAWSWLGGLSFCSLTSCRKLVVMVSSPGVKMEGDKVCDASGTARNQETMCR